MYRINETGDLIIPKGELIDALTIRYSDDELYDMWSAFGDLEGKMKKIEEKLEYLEFRISRIEDGG